MASPDRASIVVFTLAGNRYGFFASDVQEVFRAVAVVPVPNAPPVVEGIIDVRGRLAPVIDLRFRFRLPAEALSHNDKMIVLRAGGREVVVRVERDVELIDLARSDLDDAGSVVPGTSHLTRIARIPEGLVLIHDPATFLSAAEAAALDASLAGRQEEAEK